MLYDLSKETDIQRAQRRFNDLLEQRTIITLTKKVKRSLNQNSYLHLILGWFALETGYTLAEAKAIYKLTSPKLYIYNKEGFVFYRSSADLNSTEMTESIERFRNYSSAEAGIYLPEPNEDKFLQEIELELSRNKYV